MIRFKIELFKGYRPCRRPLSIGGSFFFSKQDGSETAPLEPPKEKTTEKKRAPVRRPKTWHNLAWTIAKMQLLGHGCETTKHHLNPSSGEAKNNTFGGPETALLEPLKEKKGAPVRRPKNVAQPSLDKRKNVAPRPWMRNSQTPPKSGLRQAKNGHSQGAEVAPLDYLFL